MRNSSFKFSEKCPFNHMTSLIQLDAKVFCPANYAHLSFGHLYNSGTIKDIGRDTLDMELLTLVGQLKVVCTQRYVTNKVALIELNLTATT